jgi:hypothetical protein
MAGPVARSKLDLETRLGYLGTLGNSSAIGGPCRGEGRDGLDREADDETVARTRSEGRLAPHRDLGVGQLGVNGVPMVVRFACDAMPPLRPAMRASSLVN